LGVLAPLGALPQDWLFGLAALALAFAAITAGLLSSMFHLGQPQRAWRAFSQWRSSWLSREGVLAVLTSLPAGIFGIGWVFFGTTQGLIGLCGILAAGLAVATIYCTGMIYASLKPIHQWHNHWVVPNYLVLALMSGCLILDFLIRLWSARYAGMALLTSIVVFSAWWMKERYWRLIDTTSAGSTVGSATSLGSRGRVCMLEAPHTEENYLLREMGFRIARRHRRRLRRIARLAGFAVPAVMSVSGLILGGMLGVIAAALGVASAALGIIAERWLFFAEAKHTIVLYYGADVA